MDVPTAKYVIDHYLYYLPLEEQGPVRMTLSEYRNASLDPDPPVTPQPNSIATKLYRKHGWLSDDQDASDMLKMGQDQFYILAATKIQERFGSEIVINSCPECGKLCRTPRAKQCRYCLHDWH
jgi:hypothetical protein